MYILEKSLSKAEDILYPIMDVGAVELVLTLFFLKAVVNLFLYVVKFKFCDARPGNDQLCTKTLFVLNDYIQLLLYVGSALLYFYFTYRAVKRSGKVSAFGPKTFVTIAGLAFVFEFFKLLLTFLNFNTSAHSYGETFGEFAQKEVKSSLDIFTPSAGQFWTPTLINLGVVFGFAAGIV